MSRSHRHHVLVLGGGCAGLVDARDALVRRIRLHGLLAGREPATLPHAPSLARRGVRVLLGAVERLDLGAQAAAGTTPDGARRRRGRARRSRGEARARIAPLLAGAADERGGA